MIIGRDVSPEQRVGPDQLTQEELPACLSDLSHPPVKLWYLGDPGLLRMAPDRVVAIVGTRQASQYGERVARQLATTCARAGLVVVSGLARGIDAAAHRACLAAGGGTIAVQGTGVDIPYPVTHFALHREIWKGGLVVSEMEPGMRAGPGCFPRRNRIIAALAKVTVVVEAGFKSGAINTAGQALDLGRTVAAVPGQIGDPRAAGVNHLIRDGAQVIADVEDLLSLYGLSTKSTCGHIQQKVIEGDGRPELRALVNLMASVNWDLEAAAFTSGLSIRQLSEQLLELEMMGIIERAGGSYRQAT